MKRKKYLACCVAASMMLGVASPAMVNASVQDDFSANEITDVENESISDVDIVISDIQDSEENLATEDERDVEISDDDIQEDDAAESLEDLATSNVDVDIFSSGEDSVADTGNDTGTNEEWKTLTSIKKEERILYKYDENNKTLYFKCTEPVAFPDYNLGNRTDWFVDLGADKIAQIEKIVIGDGITGIGQYCFQSKTASTSYTNLKEVVLADSVKTIGKGAFGSDSALNKINLENITSVGMAAFAKCALEQVNFSSASIEINTNAFKGCSSLNTVKAKEISCLGESAFENCTALKSFEYEGTITNISKRAFAGTGLTSFRFGDVESIGLMAFWNSALKSGCYEGTNAGWNDLVGDDEDYAEVTVHCKGDAVEAKDATCTENGWKEVGVCEVCSEHYSYPTDENAIPATGHTWSEDYVIDKEATCTEAGEKSKHCTVCDAKEDIQEIPALGHDFVSKVTKKATCTTDGTLTYTCSRCNETKTETIKATGHKWSSWKRTTAATVFKPEVQTRKCSACNKSETRNIGKKLAPKATLNASTVTLKVKQSTSRLKVTGLAKGDSVKSWKSSNSKIFTVRGKSNGTCKITGKKRGTAKLQITLASGLKKTVKVKVQTAAVKTSKITVSKNVTVRKGKRVTLKPVVTPFTSRQKVTYTSSNKKIATVSSKGVVTGKKKGTVKITVKSGSKSVKVTVKVK